MASKLLSQDGSAEQHLVFQKLKWDTVCPENHSHRQLYTRTAKYPTAPTIKWHMQIPSSVEEPGIDWCPSVILC